MRHVIHTFAMLGVFLLSQSQAQTLLKGVNLAGAEFDHGSFWPVQAEFSYFENHGMNVFRIPFKWERLQPKLNQTFDSAQQQNLIQVVNMATANGSYAIIDPHNYARYNGDLIGSAQVPDASFADFWMRLATLFADNPRVIFGLMNEPNSMSTEQWRDSANAAIAAIRQTGAAQLILVPGNAWTGAHSWYQNWYGTSNAEVMATIVDPANHFAFDLHQYFDSDFSGTSSFCDAKHGAAQLSAVTQWLKDNQFTAFLGEFAGANNIDCQTAVLSAIDYMEQNADVWLGWSWWAAGPEWGEYIFTIEPSNDFNTDRPQMNWLLSYLPVDVIFKNGFE